jgi:hypothetical protein
MTPQERVQQLLVDSGVSKIVYALVMPETEATIDDVLDGNWDGLGRNGYHHRFREAWTQKQDAAHEAFFSRWLEWVRPIVALDRNSFPYCYPTAGASEGLREVIHAYGARSRQEGFEPTIHLFEGEYEGFAAYARAAAIPVVVHRRSHWFASLDKLRATDQFYVSQPSAIDGMVWQDFDAFANEMYRKQPTAELMLDLSYVGCVPRSFHVDANHPNIAAVFLSLSKPAGVYYHRIGGMFARDEVLGLFGNKWFKNVSSLAIGTTFMERYSVHELPRKYAPIQQRVIDTINTQLHTNLSPADIFLLGVGPSSETPTDLERFLLRGPSQEAVVRVCLTAKMAYEIDPKLNPTVFPRYYEQIS